jgi:hypothetical protein
MPPSRVLLVIFILLGGGMAAILFAGSIPPAAAEDTGSTSLSTSTIVASVAMTNTVFFPLIYNAPSGLYGLVTEDGQPAADVAISLLQNYVRPPLLTTLMTTTTRADGLYQFLDVPTITSRDNSPYCQAEYYITYQNQSSDLQHIGFWMSQRLRNYNQGTAFNLSNFNLTAPQLLTPINGAHVTSPVHFSWQPRSSSDDDYALYISAEDFDHLGLGYSTDRLGYTGEYDFDIEKDACAVVSPEPCSAWYGVPLVWELLIYNQTGFGSVRAAGVFTIDS